MKMLTAVTMLFPLVCLAQPLNSMNNPNLSGYQNPTVSRLDQEMSNQQSEQGSMLNQQIQENSTLQSQRLQSQMNSDTQRVLNSQPGQRPLSEPNNGQRQSVNP